MRIVGEYSFANGKELVENKYAALLEELRSAIRAVDAEEHRTKVSKEKTNAGRLQFSPVDINKTIKLELNARDWFNHKEYCEYPRDVYVDGYDPPRHTGPKPFRDMDFVKNRLGVEVQFGKYAFMVYDVAAKMTIFRRLGIIDMGVEIVPVKEFADEMSTGVSYFEQFCWDLQQRGTGDIDTPALVWGITAD